MDESKQQQKVTEFTIDRSKWIRGEGPLQFVHSIWDNSASLKQAGRFATAHHNDDFWNSFEETFTQAPL